MDGSFRVMQTGLLGMAIALASSQVAAIPWMGTADYTQAPSATGDEEALGPFDSYDFANGVALIKPNVVADPNIFTIGDTYTGYYQSYVSAHQLSGVGLPSSILNITGDGAGYELTVTATFQSLVTDTGSGGPLEGIMTVTGGEAVLYFDTTPDYSFSGDSGFTDGTPIVSASITDGSSAYFLVPGTGFSSLSLNIDGADYDQNVFDPDTIIGGSGIFTLRDNDSGFGPTAGVTSVLGQNVELGNLLLEADGNVDLTAVPLPAAVWLLGSGLLGMLAVGRRKC